VHSLFKSQRSDIRKTLRKEGVEALRLLRRLYRTTGRTEKLLDLLKCHIKVKAWERDIIGRTLYQSSLGRSWLFRGLSETSHGWSWNFGLSFKDNAHHHGCKLVP